MKAVTLFPEHAEAFRLGIRSIETRPRRCNYRGRVALHAGMRDPDSAAARRDPISRAVMAAIPHGDPLSRGAVVASAVLTDCVPIVERDTWEGVEATGPRIIRISPAPATLWRYRDDGSVGDLVTDQLPFSDFSPGRWALLLDDIKPTTERCPQCWGDPVYHGLGCDLCQGKGKCDPVPARGQQAVPWEWTP